MEINNSYELNPQQWTPEEKALFARFPIPYQTFLRAHNGGFVDPDQCNFLTHIGREFEGQTYYNSEGTLDEWWAFLSYKNETPAPDKCPSILHEHYGRHLAEQFLPDGVIAIGRCIQNSLICLSLNQHDFGAIYYWEWYWQYPWYQAFFNRRIEQAKDAFADIEVVLNDPDHPQYQTAVDQLNYATIVKVADSFPEFVQGLFGIDSDEDDDRV